MGHCHAQAIAWMAWSTPQFSSQPEPTSKRFPLPEAMALHAVSSTEWGTQPSGRGASNDDGPLFV